MTYNEVDVEMGWKMFQIYFETFSSNKCKGPLSLDHKLVFILPFCFDYIGQGLV
jgi:hypothetical protein